ADRTLAFAVLEYVQGLKGQAGGPDAGAVDEAVKSLSRAVGLDVTSAAHKAELQRDKGLKEIFLAGCDTLGVDSEPKATVAASAESGGDVTSSPKFQLYLAKLAEKGYFKDAVEGTPEYQEKYDRLVAKYKEKFGGGSKAAPTAAVPAAGDGGNDDEAGDKLKAEGNEHLKANRFEDAVVSYTNAIKAAPTGASAHIYYSNRAAAYMHMKNFEACLDDCTVAQTLKPDYVKAHARAASANLQLGREEDARQCAKRALELDASNETAKAVMASISGGMTSAPGGAPGGMPGMGAGGMPDLASMMGAMGGGGGGMPDLSSLMNNPAMMQMAQQMMQDPEMMQRAQQMMQDPNAMAQMKNITVRAARVRNVLFVSVPVYRHADPLLYVTAAPGLEPEPPPSSGRDQGAAVVLEEDHLPTRPPVRAWRGPCRCRAVRSVASDYPARASAAEPRGAARRGVQAGVKVQRCLKSEVTESREIASKVVERPRQSGRVQAYMAIPKWFEPLLLDKARELPLKRDRAGGGLRTLLLDDVPEPASLTSRDRQFDGPFTSFSATGNHTRHELRDLYEEAMTLSLIAATRRDGAVGVSFDLVVTDRYTFAGYNLASFLQVPLVVHNPWTLLDIDDPPNYVTCPQLSQREPAQVAEDDVLSRLWNSWERLLLRAEDHKLSMESFQQVRKPLGLVKLEIPGDHCSERLVLSDTSLGWLDDPRPLPPLQQIVGAVVPPPLEHGSQSQSARAEKRQRGVNDGPSRVTQVLVQGTFSAGEMDAIVAATELANLTMVFLGERCINYALIESLCVSNDDDDDEEEEEGGFDPGADAVLLTSGDLACVHLSAMCRAVQGLLLLPKLPEQVEIARRLQRSGLGKLIPAPHGELAQGPEPAQVAAMLHEAQLPQSLRAFEERMAEFREASRLAGGTARAAYWVHNVLELGLHPFLPLDCQMPWFQRYLLDVYIVYLCALCAAVIALRVLWSFILNALDPEFVSEPDRKESLFFFGTPRSGGGGQRLNGPAPSFGPDKDSTPTSPPPSSSSPNSSKNSNGGGLRQRRASQTRGLGGLNGKGNPKSQEVGRQQDGVKDTGFGAERPSRVVQYERVVTLRNSSSL
ncbi:Small glutamine-rich tetratricopeptide repeat-containing protein 2, partial [Durusdinium trenchii]